jgi:acyl-CoA thioesterase
MAAGDEPTAEAVRRAQDAVQALHRADRASQALGIEFIEVAPGRVKIAMTVGADMVNGHGMCHGGVVFTFADSAFAFACNSYGESMVAAGASIDFIAPTPLGERITAAAVEVSRGARHGIYDVTVAASSGAVLAHFRGRCARFRAPEKFPTSKDH